MGDFRPISLVHSLPKIGSKLLANRLRPRMNELVHANQSAFIKGRNLHDNFLLVRQVARSLHRRRAKGVLLKLDISRAFDTLSWPFLFEVLRAKGFSDTWMSWIAILLSTASSRVVVNGHAGQKFSHAQGLRQGHPVSPLLFVIAMDVLTSLITRAQESGVLSKMPGCTPMQRLSIYADDVVLFVRPTIPDLRFVKEALHIFGIASGLNINYSKSTAIMIRDEDGDKELVEGAIPWSMESFPCKYLGLQLSIWQLTCSEWQPIVDNVLNFMPG